jgi:hypothetical protein
MRIVFHGANAIAFSHGFADLLEGKADIALLPDSLADDAQKAIFAAADVIIGTHFDASLPHPERLQL